MNLMSVDYVAEAAKSLSTRLGRACRISQGKKKGKIEIEYYGVDDLNDLLEAGVEDGLRRLRPHNRGEGQYRPGVPGGQLSVLHQDLNDLLEALESLGK